MHTTLDAHERRMWEGRAQAYVLSFATLCAYPVHALLDAASVGPGVTTLDVGTGPGTVAAAAAARGATIVAVDAEPSMIRIAAAAVPAADVRRAVLPDLPFPDGAFEAVVANFVINHVGDPGAAIAELRRVVRPGGRVAATIWPQPPPALQRLWADVAEAAGLGPSQTPGVAVDIDFPRTADGFAALLAGAGLRDVTCQTIEWQHQTSLNAWWVGPANGLGALGAALADASPETVARTKRCYERLAARHVANGLLSMPTAALLAVGTR
jgi:SAM-dependent methyltransferase